MCVPLPWPPPCQVIKLDQDFGATFSGIITDEQGGVRALWGSYAEQVDKEEREWCVTTRRRAGGAGGCFGRRSRNSLPYTFFAVRVSSYQTYILLSFIVFCGPGSSYKE